MDYSSAVAKLGNRDRRKLENNTYLERRDADTIAVRLHSTDVVTLRADGAVILNSGGWQTITTKDRINTYAPDVRITQASGLWYVSRWEGSSAWKTLTGKIFHDGMTIPARGAISGESPRKMESAKRRIDVLVRKYIAGYVAHVLEAGAIETPSGGDCWACYFALSSKDATTGAEVRNPLGLDHLLSHMSDDERYYVPSLLWIAAKEHAPTNFQNRLSIANSYLASEHESARESGASLVRDDLRYFFRSRKAKLAEMLARGDATT